MGALLFKQPNGKYARWSGISDTITFWNVTREEYIECRLRQLREDLERDFARGDYDVYDLDYIIRCHGGMLVTVAQEDGQLEKLIEAVKAMGASEEQLQRLLDNVKVNA